MPVNDVRSFSHCAEIGFVSQKSAKQDSKLFSVFLHALYVDVRAFVSHKVSKSLAARSGFQQCKYQTASLESNLTEFSPYIRFGVFTVVNIYIAIL